MSGLIAILLPLLLIGLILASPGSRRLALVVAPWCPLILIWPWLAGSDILLEWPLLGLSLGVDDIAVPLLLLTAVAWTLAGWQARGRIADNRRWFWSGWLGALAGMSLLLLAGNLGSFYIGYAILSLSAYLLVTHARSPESWRAGRIYLVMALAGEAAILAGVLMLAGHMGNPGFDELLTAPAVLVDSPARWLLMAGFAVKLGILPLHLWLPLAHPVAPVPASAILSGVIVKAGLLGWLRMVPALGADPASLGSIFLTLGLVTAFGGVVLGLTQSRIKTVLAYSTISQMGLLLVAFSVLFLVPDQRQAGLAMIGLLALHHGLNKACLFLACGNQPGQNWFRLSLFALPAISLSAAPLTTGYLAKNALKNSLDHALIGAFTDQLLALTSMATALLMWKAFGLARAMRGSKPVPLHPAWPTLLLAALILPWWLALATDMLYPWTLKAVISATWPLLLAALIIAIYPRLFGNRRLQLPEGDLVVVLEKLFGHPRRPGDRRRTAIPALPRFAPGPWLRHMERRQRHLPIAGLAMLVAGGVMWFLLWWPLQA
ncbi:MAG: NADH/ubiquinone/plastoquinone (complex I) [Wenzhouxiangella sp.]|nr:MAG: NADH/ubiquinone/plastoquinone (complex I) [Wenzhouxiangella sp.]